MKTPSTLLFVPAWKDRLAKSAHLHGAGAVVWDLEDGTPADEKSFGRSVIIRHFRDGDWIRVNPRETEARADKKFLDQLVESGARIGAIVLPKYDYTSPWVPAYDGVPVVAILETARALNLSNHTELVSRRIEGFIYGDADMRAEFGVVARESDVSGAMRMKARLVAACCNLPIWDSPEESIVSADQSTAACAAARDGFCGIVIIHPRFIGSSVAEFNDRDLAAREIIHSFTRAGGAISIRNGSIVAAPHVAAARRWIQ